MKNIDFIKNMSCEELADFMNHTCPPEISDTDCCIDVCELCWKCWLESEHEE